MIRRRGYHLETDFKNGHKHSIDVKEVDGKKQLFAVHTKTC